MKFIPFLLAVVSCCSCASLHDDGGDLNTEAPLLEWEQWAERMLAGDFGTELPAIDPSGWTANGAGSWTRNGAQVADYNLDGKVDYLRIADPPSSFNHNIWLDDDYDGFFDTRGGPPQVPAIGVPEFELAAQRPAGEEKAEVVDQKTIG